MRKQIRLEIERPNGEIEELDMSAKFPHMNQSIFDKIKKSTADAGRGNVLRAIIEEEKSNINKLRREYNNLHNEGADGYIPENQYFIKLSSYKVWSESSEIK